MKEKNEGLVENGGELFEEKKISRKEAIKKTGLVAASATTMMILMNSQKAQACSPSAKSGRTNDNYRQQQYYNNKDQKSNGPWKSDKTDNNNSHSGSSWRSGNDR
ncbi:hypothetical protein GM418_28460 [Maribellus comscasis]|uniref:Uncharacterized protein n=1 Tax=Maribellus comscasis TaxID=2681766 RepID=A0A6I6K229_9BACT|nr:hypothetical protein [Maribellus comscasis]QGY47460.1 hypothetical protein GM418_28460 [Maribellus comscasis]